MSSAVKEFCSDPKNVIEIPACNCLTATDMIDQDVTKILAKHNEIVANNEIIRNKNKDKLSDLDTYISSYEAELKNKRHTTACSLDRVDNNNDCHDKGFDDTSERHNCGYSSLGDYLNPVNIFGKKATCKYSPEKIGRMVLTERTEKAGSAKYKPEPLIESDVIFGEMKFECCANTINIGNEANVDMDNIKQQCDQKLGDKINEELREKGLDPISPSTSHKIKSWIKEHTVIFIICVSAFLIIIFLLVSMV